MHEAARIAVLAGPGQIVASGVTAGGSSRYPVANRRSAELEGVDEPVEVVDVVWR